MPSDPRDYNLDLSPAAQKALGDAAAAEETSADSVCTWPAPPTKAGDSTLSAEQPSSPPRIAARPFLSVHFACCGVYQRVYRAPDGTHYAGRCPRCGKAVRFGVGEGGTSSRSFTVT